MVRTLGYPDSRVSLEMASLYYADLNAAWFREAVPGLNQAFADAGWQRLSWCSDADWYQPWMDYVHPERPTASELLTRMLIQLPSSTRRVLIVGDSTLSQHYREEWVDNQIQFNWADRNAFLAESGCPGSSMWCIPGAKCDTIAWQIRKALQWENTPFDAILLCGGWNDKEGDSRELADLVTSATR